MKTTISIERTRAGLAITQRNQGEKGKPWPLYLTQSTSAESEAEALRWLAFDLLERAGYYEWNPDQGEVPVQIEKMLHENQPIFTRKEGGPA